MDPLLLFIAAALVLAYLVVWIMLREPANDPAVTHALRQPGTIVLDVREAREYRADHYPGAINIPLVELKARLDELGDRSRPIIVYCDSGMCSSRALKLLLQASFRHVVDARRMDGLPDPTTDLAAALWSEGRTPTR